MVVWWGKAHMLFRFAERGECLASPDRLAKGGREGGREPCDGLDAVSLP